MNLAEKIERSKSDEKIDFSVIGTLDLQESLVKVETSEKILVEPYWTLDNNFEGNIYAEYIADHPEYDGVYLRSEVFKRLVQSAEKLDDNYKLVLRAGHRPIDVQRKLLKECAADYKKDNPSASDQEALDHARTFVSDPDLELPPHVCGSAVDVTVFNTEANEFVDFGSEVNEDNEKSFLYYAGLSDTQKTNRLMLTTAMLDSGMATCKSEWWHYSYGDQVWAWFYGEPAALYSPIDL